MFLCLYVYMFICIGSMLGLQSLFPTQGYPRPCEHVQRSILEVADAT